MSRHEQDDLATPQQALPEKAFSPKPRNVLVQVSFALAVAQPGPYLAWN